MWSYSWETVCLVFSRCWCSIKLLTEYISLIPFGNLYTSFLQAHRQSWGLCPLWLTVVVIILWNSQTLYLHFNLGFTVMQFVSFKLCVTLNELLCHWRHEFCDLSVLNTAWLSRLVCPMMCTVKWKCMNLAKFWPRQ